MRATADDEWHPRFWPFNDDRRKNACDTNLVCGTEGLQYRVELVLDHRKDSGTCMASPADRHLDSLPPTASLAAPTRHDVTSSHQHDVVGSVLNE